MSERKPVWYAEVNLYHDGAFRQTNGSSFDAWLAEHDAELIEKLAGKLAHPEHAPYEVWASGAGDWLRGQARQMRHPRHTTESDADRTREEQDQ